MSDTASRPRPRVSRTSGPPARLSLVFPLDRVTQVELDGADLTLGREGSTVTFAVPTVSKVHLQLTWDEKARTHVATDLGSKHGTTVDGVELEAEQRRALQHQSVLRLGDAVLVYEQLRPGAASATSQPTEALPGLAAPMVRLREDVSRAAREATTALIIGATGVGKESVANELHRLSGRKGPFIAVNASALSPQLAESQLFGHAKGAFTGADSAKDGFFRAAQGGTLFLDEVGELSAELQPKLLRAVQQREVMAVGATSAVKVDVLIIAATNRDLPREVEKGAFRRDLYARLALWELRVPALSERRCDVVEWLCRLQRKWAQERGVRTPPLALSAEVVEAVVRAALPENLRTLDRLVHLLGAKGELTLDALPPWLFDAPGGGAAETVAKPAKSVKPAAPTREELQATLERLGSVRATAKHYERDRKQVYRWIEAFGLAWKDSDA
ncbi:MAG: sigma 54-interacting transcriptional regulator [Archangium sp.]